MSALVVLLSLVAGIILGVALVYGPRWLYWPIRTYSDFLRGVPLLVLIFFVYYGLPVFRINLSNFWSAVVGPLRVQDRPRHRDRARRRAVDSAGPDRRRPGHRPHLRASGSSR